LSFKLLFHTESVVDFLHFELDDGVLGIAIGMGPGKGVESLFRLAFGDEETRGFVNNPYENQLEDGRKCLNKRRSTPRPVISNMEGSEREPCSHDGANVP